MSSIVRSIFLAAVVAFLVASGAQAEAGKPHRVVIQVDQNDAEVMNLALNNPHKVSETYRAKNGDAVVEIVAYGPGLHMLRDDPSPVKDRIKQLAELSFPSTLTFSACNNTKQAMEKREGHPITIIPQATLVPAGVVRIMELQEPGRSYVRPCVFGAPRLSPHHQVGEPGGDFRKYAQHDHGEDHQHHEGHDAPHHVAQ